VERVETIVIGGGQAGLSVGYQLARRGLPFVILDGGERIGDAWRNRWDSLRLFTPARYDALAGMRFPAPAHAFPSKDAMADYLEAYADRFALPVRTGMRVDRLSSNGTGYLVTSGDHRFEADNVVVAIGSWQRPRVPGSLRSWPRESSRYTPPTTAIRAGWRTATCWSSARATPGRRSRSTSPRGEGSGCPGATSATSPSGSSRSARASCSRSCCAASSTAC